MWWSLRQGHGSAAFQAIAREVQEQATRALLLFLSLMIGGSMIYITLIHSGHVDLRLVPVFVLGVLLSHQLFCLVEQKIVLAQVSFLIGLALFFSAVLVILRVPEIAFLFTLLPLLAALLSGWPAVLAVLVLTPLLFHGLTLGFGFENIPSSYISFLFFGGSLLGGAGLAVITPLMSIVQWSIEHYDNASRNLEEVRSQRLELKQIQDDLFLANKELSRLSSNLKVMTEKAEEARRAKEDFVASVSHELRTPLNMIIGYTDLMMKSPRSYGKALPSRLLADIASIQRNSEHLVDLINDVLDLSQIDAGRMALNRSWASIQQIVGTAVDAIQPLFQSKQLYLKQSLPDRDVLIFCDSIRIREVVLNLLSNAGRYTDRGGVTLTVTADDQQVTVCVQDTGKGIEPKDLECIFEPFQQLDPLLHHQTGGSGLGLTISKRFIEMHGGKMWLESETGQGTTFYFSISISKQPDEIPPAASSVRWINPYFEYRQREHPFKAPLPPVSIRFVVVETENSIQRLFHRYMESAEVSAFKQVESAVDNLHKTAAQGLIINSSTNENMLLLQGEASQFAVPVITCWIPGRDEAARRLGVTHYLIKPIRQEVLLAQLDEMEKPKLNILLVDDDRETLHLFARIISIARPHYSVLRAESGPEALKTMRQRKPDVILLDLLMPGMDGFEVLRQKASDENIAAIPVIVVSSNDPTGLPVISNEFTVRMPNGFTVREFLDCILAIQAVFNAIP